MQLCKQHASLLPSLGLLHNDFRQLYMYISKPACVFMPLLLLLSSRHTFGSAVGCFETGYPPANGGSSGSSSLGSGVSEGAMRVGTVDIGLASPVNSHPVRSVLGGVDFAPRKWGDEVSEEKVRKVVVVMVAAVICWYLLLL